MKENNANNVGHHVLPAAHAVPLDQNGLHNGLLLPVSIHISGGTKPL
jgi:hypothetical protein